MGSCTKLKTTIKSYKLKLSNAFLNKSLELFLNFKGNKLKIEALIK